MKLFYSPPSPYARTARILHRELELSVEEVQCHPFDNPPELIEANPLGKVPCLVPAEGEMIFDSLVIAEYFNALPGPKDMFAGVHGNWPNRTLLALCIGLLDSAVAWQQDKMREPAQQSGFWQERYQNALERGVGFLQQRLTLLPRDFTVVQVYGVCALEYLDFRHPEFGWRHRFESLSNWADSLADRTSLMATRPREPR